MTDSVSQFEPEELLVTLHKAGPGHNQWARVILSLKDTDTETVHDVAIEVLVPEDAEESLVSLKQQAVERAVQIGEAALAILRTQSVADLQAQRWARDDARDAELEAWEKDPTGQFKRLMDGA